MLIDFGAKSVNQRRLYFASVQSALGLVQAFRKLVPCQRQIHATIKRHK